MSRLDSFSEAVHETLNDATVERVVHKVNQMTNRQRRRVQWYSVGGTVEVTNQAGGREDGSDNRAPAVWERRERIECWVFAENEDTLDTLFDNLIVAVDRTAPNSSVLEADYRYTLDAVNQRVPMIVFAFMVKWPVLDEIAALVEITAEEMICEFENED